MSNSRSKYEQAWRGRAGHDALPVIAPEKSLAEETTTASQGGDPSGEPKQPPPVVSLEGNLSADRGVPRIETALEPIAPTAPVAPLTSLTFKSSNVRGAELDIETGVATITFASGEQYRYANFTVEMMTAWRDAKSAGQWLHHNVRSQPAKHPFVLVKPAATDSDPPRSE